MAVSEHLETNLLFEPSNYVLHIAIVLIAVTLIWSLVREMKKPFKNPNENEDTKRMNDILED